MTTTRVAMLHTGAVVIAPVRELVQRELPDVTAVNYLDDRIVADLSDPDARDSVPGRVLALARAAVDGGAEAILLTCSSISALAAPTAAQVGVPVLRIDEAMADEAVARGGRVAVLATLATTSEPTCALLRERAERAGTDPRITSRVVEGAFAAVAGGDRDTHDRLVAAAITEAAREADVVVLAQASMASAAEAVQVDVPVLTSLEPGVRRFGELVAGLR
ncbi:aspartate/glutamate racemase family protein [Desertihabitans aurantiacus]|uniref:aspartate/glutamate racemase family protein n=1 Tax=Desertihabitans aurantiacus TaxID=2282477 RepID=UPI000DF7E34A|nr:aspartate/glutamate racemase family protein [Desertihabitans aurantiacus]